MGSEELSKINRRELFQLGAFSLANILYNSSLAEQNDERDLLTIPLTEYNKEEHSDIEKYNELAREFMDILIKKGKFIPSRKEWLREKVDHYSGIWDIKRAYDIMQREVLREKDPEEYIKRFIKNKKEAEIAKNIDLRSLNSVRILDLRNYTTIDCLQRFLKRFYEKQEKEDFLFFPWKVNFKKPDLSDKLSLYDEIVLSFGSPFNDPRNISYPPAIPSGLGLEFGPSFSDLREIVPPPGFDLEVQDRALSEREIKELTDLLTNPEFIKSEKEKKDYNELSREFMNELIKKGKFSLPKKEFLRNYFHKPYEFDIGNLKRMITKYFQEYTDNGKTIDDYIEKIESEVGFRESKDILEKEFLRIQDPEKYLRTYIKNENESNAIRKIDVNERETIYDLYPPSLKATSTENFFDYIKEILNKKNEDKKEIEREIEKIRKDALNGTLSLGSKTKFLSSYITLEYSGFSGMAIIYTLSPYKIDLNRELNYNLDLSDKIHFHKLLHEIFFLEYIKIS